MIRVEDIELPADRRELLSQFFERTSYGNFDLLSFSSSARLFLTRNGGRYHMTEDGEIEHLSGPSPDPSERI